MNKYHAIACLVVTGSLLALGPANSNSTYPKLVPESLANGDGIFSKPMEWHIDAGQPTLSTKLVEVRRVQRWVLQGEEDKRAREEWILRFRVEDAPATPIGVVSEASGGELEIADSTGTKITRSEQTYYFIEPIKMSVHHAEVEVRVQGVNPQAKSISVKGKLNARLGGEPMWCFQSLGPNWSKFQFAEKGRSLRDAEIRVSKGDTTTIVEIRPSTVDASLEWISLPANGGGEPLTPQRRWVEGDILKCEFARPLRELGSIRYVIRDPAQQRSVEVDAKNVALPE